MPLATPDEKQLVFIVLLAIAMNLVTIYGFHLPC